MLINFLNTEHAKQQIIIIIKKIKIYVKLFIYVTLFNIFIYMLKYVNLFLKYRKRQEAKKKNLKNKNIDKK